MFVCIAALVVVATGVVHPAAGAPRTPTGSRRWLALGDSYSSGEGIPGTDPEPVRGGQAYQRRDCARGTGETGATAWPVRAFRSAKDELGLKDIALVACTGAVTTEFDEQYAEATARYGGSRWDLVTFSIGGNDVEFANVLKDCLDVDSVWGAWEGAGCTVTEAELRTRIDNLAGVLASLYVKVAGWVNAGGDVVVLGYPQLIEEASRWPWSACQGILRADVPMLRSAAAYLNQTIGAAVANADAKFKGRGIRFHFLDIAHDPYEYSDAASDRHGLCARDQWLNGFTLSGTSGDFRKERSFHPTQEGHDNTGRVLTKLLGDYVRFDDAPKADISDAELLKLAACTEGTCKVTGRIPLEHQRWGSIILASVGPSSGNACPTRALFAVDATKNVVWDPGVGPGLRPLELFAPAGAAGKASGYGSDVPKPIDASGRIFFDWNPGRYNGVTVLAASTDGFSSFHSLPDKGYDTKFYAADVTDVENDGVYEIRSESNDCEPDCASGTQAETIFRFSGSDFTPVPAKAKTSCGKLRRPASNGQEDIASNIAVVGVSCWEAVVDGGPKIVDAIQKAIPAWQRAGTARAAGYGCTITAETTSDAVDYDCKGKGTITFVRYTSYS